MVEYCPKCNAQLPPGLDQCPRCGHRFRRKSKDEYTWRDIALIAGTVLAVVLIPIMVIIGIIWLLFLH